MKLPQNVQTAIKLLENANFEVYVVGGAVRDHLLGKIPSDYDLSTNATPEEMKLVFKDYFIVDTGIKHGTISVMINNKFLEITTYRFEEAYTDYRRPDKVYFMKDIKEDLARRDFTINAICFNKGFVDLFGGTKDLEAKIIRAIGDPVKRFTEDPLRILRALRFASVLNFEIEENTKNAVIKYFSMLDMVSIERINLEMSKLLLGDNFKKVIFEFRDLLEKHIFKFKVTKNKVKIATNVDKDLPTRLACLFLGLDKNEVNKRLTELKYPKKIIKTVLDIITNYNIELEAKKTKILSILKTLDYDVLGKIIAIKKAYYIIEGKSLSELESVLDLYKGLKNKYLRVNNLKINGKDLMQIGFKEGVEIKIVLEKLLDDCINGLNNNKEDLLKKAKEYLNV